MQFEVIRHKKGNVWICRDKKESGRRKTYLKSPDKKECVKKLRCLYLQQARNMKKNKKNNNNIDACKEECKE